MSQGVMTGVRGVLGVKGRQGGPRWLKGTSGVYQGVKGAPGESRGVKRDIWGVQGGREGCNGYQVVKGDATGIQGGVKRAYRCPRGSRGVLGVSQGSREVQGIQGS